MPTILLPRVHDELDERRTAALRRPRTTRPVRRFGLPVLRPAF